MFKVIYFSVFKNKIKQYILNLLRLLPITSEKIGPPKGFYRFTYDWVNNFQKKQLQKKYIKIHPKHWIYRLEPKTIDINLDWRFCEGYLGNTFETPATFVSVIPNGRVFGSNGTVITPDDKLLADVSIEFGLIPENAEYHPIFNKIRLPKLVKTNETVAVLSAAGGTNYFHWMFDVLPRIFLLQSANVSIDIDKFLFNPIKFNFQEETLNILGIPQEKVITTDDNFHLKSNKLIVPSLPGITGSIPHWVCDFLRKEFLLKKAIHNGNREKRIYISRADAKHRRVINENELIDFLAKFDFNVYTMEKLSVIEQASIFSSAEVIVSPHGAALTNLVFCSPKTKVVELFSPNYLNPCYRALSNQVELDYWYLLGEGQPPIQNTDDHLICSVEENIQLDLNSLAKVIELLELVN